MSVTVKLVVALFVMIVLWLARYQSNDTLNSQANSQCEASAITVESGNFLYDSRKNHNISPSLTYGTKSTVYCYGTDPKKLVLTANGQKLNTITYEDRIVWIFMSIEMKTEFVCKDVESDCESSVILSVKPSIAVVAKILDDRRNKYIIEYGQEGILFVCQGPVSGKLVLTKAGRYLPAVKADYDLVYMSPNTIVFNDHETNLQISEYVCTDTDTNVSNSVIVKVIPKMYVHVQNKIKHPIFYTDDGRGHSYKIAHETIIEVFCHGPRIKFKANEQENSEIKMENVDRNTIKLTTMIIGEKYDNIKFDCISEYSDYNNTVTVEVEEVLQREVTKVEVPFEMVVRSSNGALLFNSNRHESKTSVKYGDNITIECLGTDASKITLTEDGEALKWNNGENFFNRTAEKLGISEFVCTNENAFKQSVFISIIPSMLVISSNILEYHRYSTTIEYGVKLIEISCQGPASANLIMVKDKKELPTESEEALSNNKIKHTLFKPDLQKSEYHCTDTVTKTSTEMTVTVIPLIYIEVQNKVVPPERYDNAKFYIFYLGTIIDVYCSGPRAVKLKRVSMEGNEDIIKENVENKNTVTMRTELVELHTYKFMFKCYDSKRPEHESIAWGQLHHRRSHSYLDEL